ncbi:hypothetical protein CLG96_06055 [Sphingomonas oleivorans]|uniref:Diguanylate cyclase n=1 Tax=Sphingomonas oleivorans TaxID=1735121 RepID=A0A2T5FZL0_9SPHN|nr:hypothetical protein [Sphingomonas oleivorans]PTQ12125.1 hypothetical protein CLG96_06055 [Sphingomonas oleivorans]
MKRTEPLQLYHSWPIFERGQRFNLGLAYGCDALPWRGSGLAPLDRCALADHGIGLWECDLRDNALRWSAEVHDIFGLPPDARVSRAEAVALYCEESRAAMERLRAYALKHGRGFTLDAEIRPARGGRRWMRLIAAPIWDGRHIVRLHGLKQDVSHLYR